jgi:hypothetical protein
MDFEQLDLDRWTDDGGFVAPEVETSAPIATPTAYSGARPELSENEQTEVNFVV